MHDVSFPARATSNVLSLYQRGIDKGDCSRTKPVIMHRQRLLFHYFTGLLLRVFVSCHSSLCLQRLLQLLYIEILLNIQGGRGI